MKVLLDHHLPHRLRHHFRAEDDVFTCYYLGWTQLENSDLLKAAEKAGFFALITIDSSIPYQNIVADYGVAVVLLKRGYNHLPDVLELMPEVVELLPTVKPGRISCGRLVKMS